MNAGRGDAVSTSAGPLGSGTWERWALGLGLIAAGAVVALDMVFASVASAVLIGATACVAGLFELFVAAITRRSSRPGSKAILGLCYLAFGVAILLQPGASVLILGQILAFLLLGSGVVRVYLGVERKGRVGLLVGTTGILGVLAGLALLLVWSERRIWVLGLLVGADLALQGLLLLFYDGSGKRETRVQ
jgi:uncharacterized membrane protein HdeD (DUF308 family)